VSSEHPAIGRALELLTQGLFPFVQRELQGVYGDDWWNAACSSFRNDRIAAVMTKIAPAEWDSHALLTVMWDQWNGVFRQRLGLLERSLVSELREFRNRWAHQGGFDGQDAYRLLDSSRRLLAAIDAAPALIEELQHLQFDVLREMLGQRDDAELQRGQTERQARVEAAVFGFCGVTVVVTTLLSLVPRNPLAGGLLVAFTGLAFGYLIWQRLSNPPTIHGVHECRRCRKIVYSAVCPYCAPAPVDPDRAAPDDVAATLPLDQFRPPPVVAPPEKFIARPQIGRS
jgi:hypothetical protein